MASWDHLPSDIRASSSPVEEPVFWRIAPVIAFKHGAKVRHADHKNEFAVLAQAAGGHLCSLKRSSFTCDNDRECPEPPTHKIFRGRVDSVLVNGCSIILGVEHNIAVGKVRRVHPPERFLAGSDAANQVHAV